jgi:hypothetical protein
MNYVFDFLYDMMLIVWNLVFVPKTGITGYTTESTTDPEKVLDEIKGSA